MAVGDVGEIDSATGSRPPFSTIPNRLSEEPYSSLADCMLPSSGDSVAVV